MSKNTSRFDIASRKKLRALFDSLGANASSCEGKLRQILVDFYEVMAGDLMIGFFFAGRDLVAIAEMQKSFLMKAMGVSESYTGRVPARAHENIAPILEGHFDRRLVLLAEVLRRHGLGEKDIRTWVAFENSFRDVIVQTP